uniref:Uncharacterized protein n=1 Tax=Romanomermis culicivorax TaxID=13658 RepID=A0A915KTA4_ROMCU
MRNSKENQMDIDCEQEPPPNSEVVVMQKSVDILMEALKSLEIDAKALANGEAKSTLKKHLMAIKSAVEKLSIQELHNKHCLLEKQLEQVAEELILSYPILTDEKAKRGWEPWLKSLQDKMSNTRRELKRCRVESVYVGKYTLSLFI